MSLPLAGKIAIVTGSSRGIGAAIASRLASDGATVVVNYANNKAAADALVERVGAEGKGTAVAMKADMTSLAETLQLVEDTVKRFGKIDILVLNAAIMPSSALDAITEKQFDEGFEVNVKIPLFMVQAVSKHMSSGGRVVFMSSSQTKVSLVRPQYLLYVSCKGAIEQATRVLAKDLGARGITVNAVAPSATDTDLFRGAIAGYPHLAEEVANLHPLKRIGRPEEIGPVVAFLAREEASWVNGQTIFVNGGYAV